MTAQLKERTQQLWAKVKELFGKLNKRMRILIIAVLALLAAILIGVNVYRSTRPYSVLFTGLSGTDMSSVLTYLNDHNVTNYKIENNDTILVPEGQEVELKAGIIQQGYPTSGFGYDRYLNNVGTLSSDTDRQTLFLYDLQDRLAATVRWFDGVQEATVTISQGSDRRSILNSTNVIEATAEVTLMMEPGRTLSEQQATAIRNLVSHAVQGLQIDNVAIVDSAGNVYSSGAGAGTSDSSKLKLELESQINARLRASILQVLAPLFGADNLSISVHSTVDISRTYREDTTYDEPAWAADGSTGGKGIIGTWVWDSGLVRGDENGAGGVVGTGDNADLNEYVINSGDVNGNEQQVSTSGSVDYKVGEHSVQSESQGGVISDVMVAISIDSSKVDVPNSRTLIPLVARAAGIGSEIQDEKISILAFPFYQEETPEQTPFEENTGLPNWVLYALIGGGVLFLILLILIIVLRRRAKKKKKEQEEAEALAARAEAAGIGSEQMAILEQAKAYLSPDQITILEQAIAATAGRTGEGADIMGMTTDTAMQLRQDLRNFVEENPAIAAQLLKNWLLGGENHNA